MCQLRFLLALYAGKLCAFAIDLVAKGRGTNLPGVIALKIDPAFLSHIRGIDPEKAVFITGTNGKSTTTKLLHHILTHAGHRVISNLDGANMTPGVAVPLIRACSLTGHIQTDYIVMETDERYVSRIRAQLPAKFLGVTNIQKDQVQRNGEPSFILNKVRDAITPDMTLLVNRDEPNACSLSISDAGTVIGYSVEANSRSFRKDGFFDLSVPCPICHNPVEFHTRNIENIGPFRCPVCGLGTRNEGDYIAAAVSFEGKHFSMGDQQYPFHYNMPQFLYSYTLAVTAAKTLGIPEDVIAAALDSFRNGIDRVTTRKVGEYTVKYLKMKQENSETLQTVLHHIAEDQEDKLLLFGNDEYIDFYPPYVNTCYLFDCDFRGLRDSTEVVSMSTAAGHGAGVRFLYDGFAPEKIFTLPDSLEQTLKEFLAHRNYDNVYLVEEIPFWQR